MATAAVAAAGGVAGVGGGNGGAYQGGSNAGSAYPSYAGGSGGSGVGGGGGTFGAVGADGSAGGAGGTWSYGGSSGTAPTGGSGGTATAGGAGGTGGGKYGVGANGGNGGWTGKIGGGGGGGVYAYSITSPAYASTGGRGGNAAGGIYNTGTLYIGSGVTLSNDQAAAGGGAGGNYTGAAAGNGGSAAGAIWNTGTLDYDSTTLTLSSNAGAGGLAGKGANGATSGSNGTGTNDIFNAAGSTVDSTWTPPLAVPSTPDMTAATDTGISSTDNITYDTTPTFTGTGTSGDTVYLVVDGTRSTTDFATVSSSGTWSITSSTLSSGSHTIAAEQSDGTSFSGASSGLSVTIDTTPPTVTDANISISGATGTGGDYKIGDVVTATWNDTSSGDANTDIANATVDFSQFGGGSAVNMTDSSGVWTASYTILAGNIDATNRNVSVTANDIAGNTTTTADTTNATVDDIPPTVTDANISISGATGIGGDYKIGDVVTATWNDTSTGDANPDVVGATTDFSQFGGGSAITMTDTSGVWTATYTITQGSIDATNRNVSVTATDDAGNTTTAADTTNATVDNIPPTVTDANISISGATGTGGDYKIGDVVTATWNDTATGDNNTDTMSGATTDFSQFGGGSAVAMNDNSGVWTATYTITAGNIDAANRNVSVTATDDAGNTTTTADTTNATVDDIAPVVTDANISISGATGIGGAFKVGDIVTATWNDTSTGDNNTDTIVGVTTDFSQFGGGSAVAMTDNSGVWTATYTVTTGTIDATNRNVSVTATDNAGNVTTTADTTNASVDNQPATVTDANLSISGATGLGGAYKVGDTVTATWNDTSSGDANTDTLSGATIDFSQFGGPSSVAMTDNAGVWTASYKITQGNIDAVNRNVSISVTDDAGNVTSIADTTNATVDNIPPTVTDANISISGSATGTYGIGDTVTATWNDTATGDANTDTIVGATVNFSQFGGGSAVAMTDSGGIWSASYKITQGSINATNRNVSVTAEDNAGNTTTAADTTNATVDNVVNTPVLPTSSSITAPLEGTNPFPAETSSSASLFPPIASPSPSFVSDAALGERDVLSRYALGPNNAPSMVADAAAGRDTEINAFFGVGSPAGPAPAWDGVADLLGEFGHLGIAHLSLTPSSLHEMYQQTHPIPLGEAIPHGHAHERLADHDTAAKPHDTDTSAGHQHVVPTTALHRGFTDQLASARHRGHGTPARLADALRDHLPPQRQKQHEGPTHEVNG